MIAPEGRAPVLGCAAAAVLAHLTLGGYAALPLWLAAGFLLYLFHDPVRRVPALPLAVVSPVDGSVLSVRESRDPWLERNAQRIGIHLPRLGISPLRSPTEGKVMDYKLSHEAYRSAEFCVLPRRTAVCHALWVRTDEGDDVVFVVSSPWRVLRLRFTVSVGERIGQGQRCGFAWFASRVDVLVPVASRPEVRHGDRVLAGVGVVATLVHRVGVS